MRRRYGDQRVISALALSLATLLMFLSVNVKTLVRADGGGGRGGGGGALASGGKIGCLFAPDLCEEYQSCLNDALFGKCASPGATGFVYTSDDISAEEAGRLRELLQTLASRGFSWEDDVTQRVLSRELSKLQKTPLSRPVSAPEAGLRRGLQKYLQQVAKADGVYSPWKSADGTILLLAALQEYLDQTQPNSARPRARLFRSHDQEEEEMEDTPPTRFRPITDGLRDPTDGDDDVNNDDEKREDDTRSSEDKVVLAKLLEYLDKSPAPPSLNPSPSPHWSPRRRLVAVVDNDNNNNHGNQGVSTETVRSRVRVRQREILEQQDRQVLQLQGWIATQEQKVDRGQSSKVVPPPPKVQPLPLSSSANQELQLDVVQSKSPFSSSSQSSSSNQEEGAGSDGDDVYGYVITDKESLPTDEGLQLVEVLARRSKIQMTDFLELNVVGSAVIFRVRSNSQNITTADVANVAVVQKEAVEREGKVKILEAGVTDRSNLKEIPTKYSQSESTKFLILTVLSLLCIVGVLLASLVVYCLRHRSQLRDKLTNLGTDVPDIGAEASAAYQELCRQRMTMKAPPTSSSSANQNASSRLNSVSSQLSDSSVAMMSSGVAAAAAANSSSPSRVSPAPWSGGEGLGAEPGADQSSMDISTGHMILSYMEDHLKNKDRLQQEWEGLCKYEAEPNASTVGLSAANLKKNRTPAVVAYDHCRFRLRAENNPGSSDYINASPIMDHDPRYPAYIATQGPLPSTVADFWQMVWESGAVVIVMLTPLVESGVKQCYHYWPDEGSNLYHIYEVNLVSEHVWCEDFLVRSFYLKNLQTNESRSVSQFHFHTWNSHTRGNAVPPDTHTLLQFRRKVNKCFRGRSCPIIVHCSDGVGRTGTYILIDMVLNRMAKGAKEIDIAATLEHLRDQRPSMVQTKEQFEFVLTTIAEEVNTILKTLPQ